MLGGIYSRGLVRRCLSSTATTSPSWSWKLPAAGFAAALTGFGAWSLKTTADSQQQSVKPPVHYHMVDQEHAHNTKSCEDHHCHSPEQELCDHKRHYKPMVFSGSANLPLAQEICAHLGTKLGDMTIKKFADGEIGVQVHENVRSADVYIIQPTCPPGVNDHLMELVLMISTFRRASARKITAIIPYFGYARQDRKMTSRVPISAADVALLLESMGVDRVVAVDLHCGQIQGFFGPRTPCDNLEGAVVALPFFAELGLQGENTVIVSPDAGGVYRAKKFRDGLRHYGMEAGLAMIIKQRLRANTIDRMDLVGDVKNQDCIIVDDMIDTAGTLCQAAEELKRAGAKRVYAFATHGLFNGPAIERIDKSCFEKVVICNTVPLSDSKAIDKIKVLSIGEFLAQAIARIHMKQSVSELFNAEFEAPETNFKTHATES
uniref:ribose-phosphate diphosphokinase n=1 Tax=Spongospora subterranea TaxID=70186 RepID=A0A0H5R8B2_9EUKA|eukprot:CRZ10370.1 hypothetical protein [Spongospora subterranea]